VKNFYESEINQIRHNLADLSCSDYVCATLNIIGSLLTIVGLIIGNIDSTKKFTLVTGSITVGCRSVRYYSRQYGTFWGCTAVIGQGTKKCFTLTINK
jgi:hypothetical protein